MNIANRFVNVGCQSLTSITGATALTVPAGATCALISAVTGAVSLRDDGTAPTQTVGIQIPAGSTLEYSGSLGAVQIISASGTVFVSYYKGVG